MMRAIWKTNCRRRVLETNKWRRKMWVEVMIISNK